MCIRLFRKRCMACDLRRAVSACRPASLLLVAMTAPRWIATATCLEGGLPCGLACVKHIIFGGDICTEEKTNDLIFNMVSE